MPNFHRFVLVIGLALIFALPMGEPAHAGQIEWPTRQVERIDVVYAEPMPTESSPNRQYLETNDGAAYTFRNFRHCWRSALVPPRVCRSAFWYAR